jgi:hypothetical protein
MLLSYPNRPIFELTEHKFSPGAAKLWALDHRKLWDHEGHPGLQIRS